LFKFLAHLTELSSTTVIRDLKRLSLFLSFEQLRSAVHNALVDFVANGFLLFLHLSLLKIASHASNMFIFDERYRSNWLPFALLEHKTTSFAFFRAAELLVQRELSIRCREAGALIILIDLFVRSAEDVIVLWAVRRGNLMLYLSRVLLRLDV
jgi:hypothetical protein